jgi:single-stranded DNA-binding protein
MRQYSSYWTGDGNLTAPIEIRYLPSGTPVGTTRIAFLNLVFWGEAFVEVAKLFQKGQNIHAEGALKSRTFESGGYKRTVTEITVTRAFGIASSGSDDHNELPEEEGTNGSNDANSNDEAGWPQVV